MMPPPTLRLAAESDLPAINDIYNHYVLNSTSTYQEEPETLASRDAWFAAHGAEHPVTVATIDDVVVGWGSLSRFRQRTAFRHTVEDSVYLAPTHLRRGIGRLVLADLIDRARAIGHHTVIAGIDGEQPASVALHGSLGFVEVAFLRQVGYKFNRWLDVRYMQLMLENPTPRAE